MRSLVKEVIDYARKADDQISFHPDFEMQWFSESMIARLSSRRSRGMHLDRARTVEVEDRVACRAIP